MTIVIYDLHCGGVETLKGLWTQEIDLVGVSRCEVVLLGYCLTMNRERTKILLSTISLINTLIFFC